MTLCVCVWLAGLPDVGFEDGVDYLSMEEADLIGTIGMDPLDHSWHEERLTGITFYLLPFHISQRQPVRLRHQKGVF